MKKTFSILSIVLLLGSCAPRADGSYSRASLGTLTGAFLGGVVGSHIGGGSGRQWATAGGALYGATVGNEWGATVDRAQFREKTATSDGVFHNVSDGAYKSWVNPNSGRSESIRLIQTFSPRNNRQPPCRLFETTRHGRYSAIGMVCLDEYGRWRLID
ncbi:MAG: glycine zipper 2TM domain-containing protein [Proteobacteria bacterium]|nr:glycine zipper 2TM domain-containing protein [Pseudomonadota bacterium]